MAAPGYGNNQGYPPAQGYQPPQGGPGHQPAGGYPSPTPYPPAAGAAAPMPAAVPSAPKFEHIAGYENVNGLAGVAAGPPPAYVPPNQPTERPVEQFDKAAAIRDDEAKEALELFVADNCCYGKSPAQDMSIKQMDSSSAFHYKLETFIESRTCNWHQEAFTGQPIDGPQNGLAPPAWSIQVQQPPPFQPKEIFVEIPHTANVQPCHECFGLGRVKCKHCHGDGKERCSHCNGSGRVFVGSEQQLCQVCHGLGHKECYHCHGQGMKTCEMCKGNGRMKSYLRLKVTWRIESGEHIVEKTALPDQLITRVSGIQIFGQEYPRVFPLTSFFVQDINAASQRIVNNHSGLANSNIIHRQRHSLRSVPVNEVLVSWNDKEFRFWAYGVEKKVHCPDYPQQCCCGCTIL